MAYDFIKGVSASYKAEKQKEPFGPPINGASEINDFAKPPATSASLTEDDIADEFATKNHERVRYDHDANVWYIYEGGRWRQDRTNTVTHDIRMLCRERRKGVRHMGSSSAVAGAEKLARSDIRLGVNTASWDPDPWKLGSGAELVDLKTGETSKANPLDMISRSTRVVSATKGTPFPYFQKFLCEVTGGDTKFQRFLQQCAGYCLTGLTKEQKLLFIHGPGGNGKSVFINLIAEIMGDYAIAASMETFVSTAQGHHLCDLARLRYARLVHVSEVERGQRWYEARINQMTGGDPITANFMRNDPFEYKPKFKLLFSGNHRPELQGVTAAARRRFLFVPFMFQPKEVDCDLPSKLQEEYPAILRWAIDGCLDWQMNGLLLPSVVKEATDNYFEIEDLVGQWIEDCCFQEAALKTSAADLYASFKKFALDCNEDPMSSRKFGIQMRDRGFKAFKSNSTQFCGISLKIADGS